MEKKKAPKRRKQLGYTLLEYCAGAAILGGIVYAGMTTMGGNLSGAFVNIGAWATERGNQMSTSGTTGN